MENPGTIKFLLLSRKLSVPSPIKTEIIKFEVGSGQNIHEVLDGRLTAFSTETDAVFILDVKDVKNLLPSLRNFMNSSLDQQFVTQSDLENLEDFIIDTFKLKVDVKKLGKVSRKKELVVARQLFYTILKLSNYGSLTEIGSTLSVNRDHATVLHSVRVIENLIATKDKSFYNKIFSILQTYNLDYKYL